MGLIRYEPNNNIPSFSNVLLKRRSFKDEEINTTWLNLHAPFVTRRLPLWLMNSVVDLHGPHLGFCGSSWMIRSFLALRPSSISQNDAFHFCLLLQVVELSSSHDVVSWLFRYSAARVAAPSTSPFTGGAPLSPPVTSKGRISDSNRNSRFLFNSQLETTGYLRLTARRWMEQQWEARSITTEKGTPFRFRRESGTLLASSGRYCQAEAGGDSRKKSIVGS